MTKYLSKLLSLAGPSLSLAQPGELPTVGSKPTTGLWALLRERNGFYAFESALHVFPSLAVAEAAFVGLEEWNSRHLWRDSYMGMADEYLFFAEDTFGSQFAIKDGTIISFDPETAEPLEIAESLEDWAFAILDDLEFMTGHPIARDWQMANGPIAAGMRLVPKQPFVLGGGFDVGNMMILDAVKGMRFRGDLAVQIRDLPDGAEIEFQIVD